MNWLILIHLHVACAWRVMDHFVCKFKWYISFVALTYNPPGGPESLFPVFIRLIDTSISTKADNRWWIHFRGGRKQEGFLRFCL